MAHISYSRKGEMLQALFKILAAHPDGLMVGEALNLMQKALPPTSHELENLPSGPQRYGQTIRWSTVDAAKAGWMHKENGLWTLTDKGRKALEDIQNPYEFGKTVTQLYHQWRQQIPQTPLVDIQTDDANAEETESLEKDASVRYEDALVQSQAAIDDYLHGMEPYDFQKLVAELLNAMGYHVNWIAPPGRDSGVDILAFTDPLGTQGPRIKVQVKQQQKSVTEPDLKSFMSNIGLQDSGIFFCTGGFTADARRYARTQETKRIMLVDTQDLVRLWVANIAKLKDQAWQKLPLTPIWFLTPEN